METTTTRRRFTPVDDLTMALEFEDAHEAVPGRRWPVDWFAFVTTRALRDARIIRFTTTKEASR